jgi:hypothetical protein
VDRLRIILDLPGPENAILAVRAAGHLLIEGHRDGVLEFENGVRFWVRKTKTGVSARQISE